MYSNAITNRDLKFDIVLVDGKDRVNCLKAAAGALEPAGVIILDDSERTEYEPGIHYLTGNHFRRLDFWGMAPAINYLKCTTVFYRQGNCLGI